MGGGLIPVGGGGADARCVGCGRKAVGPCASCHDPLCGDCCVLTEGGAGTYAICARCEAESGRSVGTRWLPVALWIGAPIVALALLVWLLGVIAG